MKLRNLILFLIVLLCCDLFAQEPNEDKISLKKSIREKETILLKKPDDVQTLKTLGILYHNLSRLGEKSASDKAVRYLEKANELTNESDVEIIAYLGSSFTLKGRDAILPFQKLSYVKKGCKIIDKAVNKEPKNIAARMVRINNSLALPSFFNRLKYAEKDCLFLITSYEKRGLQLSKKTLTEIYFHLGEVYYREDKLDKAKEYWQKTIEILPKSYFALQAEKRIKQFKQ